jgi:hypothetical protein
LGIPRYNVYLPVIQTLLPVVCDSRGERYELGNCRLPRKPGHKNLCWLSRQVITLQDLVPKMAPVSYGREHLSAPMCICSNVGDIN